MSPTKFTFIFFIALTTIVLIFFRSQIPFSSLLPSSSLPSPAISENITTAPIKNFPQTVNLPAPTVSAPGWLTQSVPQAQISFDYPQIWGTPSASLTVFDPQENASFSGSLLGVFFLTSSQLETPIFLEFTSSDFQTPNRLPNNPCPQLTSLSDAPKTYIACHDLPGYQFVNAFISSGEDYGFYTYASTQLSSTDFPHLRIYVNLPTSQNKFTDLDLIPARQMAIALSSSIFSQSDLSETDSTNLKYFKRIVSSIKKP